MVKKKFTWIDFAIILIILISVAGVANKFAKAKIAAPTADKEKLQITYYVENVPDSVVQAIKDGDPVRETIQSSDFGKVIKIEPHESVFWECNEAGQYVASGKKGYSSLYITMEAYGIFNRDGVTVDRSVYFVGQSISLYAGNSELNNGRISKIVKAQ